MKTELITFSQNGVEIKVIGNFEDLKSQLISLKSSWEDNFYCELYTEVYVSIEQFIDDICRVFNLIESIEKDLSLLYDYVSLIRKKKNNKLWSKSGRTITSVIFASQYFTDFTNAWSVPQLRLDVVDETTCELVFRSRTETY